MLRVPSEEPFRDERQKHVPFLNVGELAKPLPGSLGPELATLDGVQGTLELVGKSAGPGIGWQLQPAPSHASDDRRSS